MSLKPPDKIASKVDHSWGSERNTDPDQMLVMRVNWVLGSHGRDAWLAVESNAFSKSSYQVTRGSMRTEFLNAVSVSGRQRWLVMQAERMTNVVMVMVKQFIEQKYEAFRGLQRSCQDSGRHELKVLVRGSYEVAEVAPAEVAFEAYSCHHKQ